MRFRLIEHNSIEQQRWGGNDDTRIFLKVGKIYTVRKEVHSWHTKIIINGKKFNSVCFKEVRCRKKQPKNSKQSTAKA